jgi:hypothetical protein
MWTSDFSIIGTEQLQMAKTMQIELPTGKKLIFGSPSAAGLQEVSLSSALPKATAGQFENALSTLGDLVDLLEKQVGSLPSRPSKVEMEFGASLSGDCNLWIVSGEGKAEFKVKLSWDGAKGPA